MLDREAITIEAKRQRRSIGWMIARVRTDELLLQIEKIQELLDHPDADIRLRASQEIRDLNLTINAVQKAGDEIPQHRQRNKKPKKKKVIRPDQNLFRPV